jgi:hypothetical protein
MNPLEQWFDNQAILLYGKLKGGTPSDLAALSGSLDAVPTVAQADFNKWKQYLKIAVFVALGFGAIYLIRRLKEVFK